jgi:putative polyhydroxyalkanoate system protein
MPNIRITREHQLGRETARIEVERIAHRVKQETGADFAWRGDTLSFAHAGVTGQITITDDRLDLSIQLNWMLSAMKRQIEQKIVGKIDERLARHQRRDSAQQA